MAFQLARTLRKAPRAIAQELAPAVGTMRVSSGSSPRRTDTSICFWNARICAGTLDCRAGRGSEPAEKTIVEHTAINPNKAAHVGHLRNAALGDTLVRVLRFCGTPVEVQNYIDDMGVQVADVIVGFTRARTEIARRGQADRRHDAFRLLLLGPLLTGHRMVRRR